MTNVSYYVIHIMRYYDFTTFIKRYKKNKEGWMTFWDCEILVGNIVC